MLKVKCTVPVKIKKNIPESEKKKLWGGGKYWHYAREDEHFCEMEGPGGNFK
jgi:hypothetical protein